MVAEVVALRTSPALNDIPALLRALADRIDSGEEQGIESMFIVIPRKGDYPDIRGWGIVDGDNHPVVQLELAKAWFANNLTSRAV